MSIPIIVCSVNKKCLAVMRASVTAYSDSSVYVWPPTGNSFGESYNAAMEAAFRHNDEIVIANDDVVLTPETMQLLAIDVERTKEIHGNMVGFVATMTDNCRQTQSIRFSQYEGDRQVFGKWQSESQLREIRVISPIFAWISKKAFEAAQFPPLNWYSDDVMCEDLNRKGFHHFISRAYVHHVGSQTVGTDYNKLNDEAMPWLRANRPEYVQQWFGKAA